MLNKASLKTILQMQQGSLQMQQEFLQKLQKEQVQKAISIYLTKVHDNTADITNRIRNLACLSQAERTLTRTRTQITAQDAVNPPKRSKNTKGDTCNTENRFRTDVKMDIPDIREEALKELLNDSEHLDLPLDPFEKLNNLKDEKETQMKTKILEQMMKKLANIATTFNNYYKENGFRDNAYKDSNIKSKEYENGVRNAIEKLQKQFSREKQSTNNNDKEPAPGAFAAEVIGTQPWLRFLFEKIGSAIEENASVKETSSPARKHVRTEVRVDGVGRSRRADLTLHNQSRFEAVLRMSSLQTISEIKPGSRRGTDIDKLLNEALEQGLAHAAKKLLYGLYFLRVGVDAHATCFIANMGSVMIFKLSLKDVGTPEVNLKLEKSDYFPLMPKDMYEKWYLTRAENLPPGAFEVLGNKMYKGNDKGMFLHNGVKVPKGYMAIATLMSSSSKDIFGLDVEYETYLKSKPHDETIEIGSPIGNGAHAIVFERKNQINQVVKVSKDGLVRDLEREISILQLLNGHDNSYLPKLVMATALEFSRYDKYKCQVPALVTSPRGISIHEAISIHETKMDKDFILKVVQCIAEALTFLHSRLIYHLDVNPRNIIIVEGNNAVLIDFSISLHHPSNMKDCEVHRKGVWGTVNYVHQRILQYHPNSKWIGTNQRETYEEFDFAGLYFTAAVLANGGEIPWPSLHDFPRVLGEKVVEARNEIAAKIVGEYYSDLSQTPFDGKDTTGY